MKKKLFIELTHRGTGRKFSVNPRLITAIDADKDGGSIVMFDRVSFHVDEKRDLIEELSSIVIRRKVYGKESIPHY